MKREPEPARLFRLWRLSLPQKKRSLWAAGALLGVSGTQMQRYEQGKQRVPPEKCARYEKITKIPREKLRPDVFRPARKPRKPTRHAMATIPLEAVG